MKPESHFHSLPLIFAALLVAACGAEPRMEPPREALWVRDSVADSTANATADSIVLLDPATEFEAAIARGDLRPIGVCGFACMPSGFEQSDHGLLPTDSLNIVRGTGDAISGPGMARLNAVADTYATKYNRLLVEYLKRHKATRQGQ